MFKVKLFFLLLSIIFVSCQGDIEGPSLDEDENQENLSEYDKIEIAGEIRDMITKEVVAPASIEVFSQNGNGPIQTINLIEEYESYDGTYIAELDFIPDTSRLIRVRCSDITGNKYFKNSKLIWIDSMDRQLDIDLCPISFLKTEIENISGNVDKLFYEFTGYQCDEIEEPIHQTYVSGFSTNSFTRVIPLPVSSEINAKMKIYQDEELIIDTVMLLETVELDTIKLRMEF